MLEQGGPEGWTLVYSSGTRKTEQNLQSLVEKSFYVIKCNLYANCLTYSQKQFLEKGGEEVSVGEWEVPFLRYRQWGPLTARILFNSEQETQRG